MQKNANSQSTTSLDLNKFKINSISYNPKNDNSKMSIPNNNDAFDNSEENRSLNLPSFKPYNVYTFLGKTKQNKNNFNSDNNNTVNNISVISSNLKYIMHLKKLEEEKAKNEQKDPVLAFKKSHQKESRRMLVEFLKISLLSEKTPPSATIQDILEDNNISPLILQKKTHQSKSKSNSLTSKNQIHPIFRKRSTKRGSDITLGESMINMTNNSEASSLSVQNIGMRTSMNNVSNSLKLVDIFLTNMDDDSTEKISLLTFITIPRLLNMIITQNQKIPFIFTATPSNIACSFGIESYIFKWNDCKTFNQIGSFDLINVDTCSINQNYKKQFDIIISTNNNWECFTYSIEAENENDAKNYVNSINFISQLIKCRAFVRKRK